jgi:hypothetical protein
LLDDIDYEIEQGTGRLIPMYGVPYEMSLAGKAQAEASTEVSQETYDQSSLVWD